MTPIQILTKVHTDIFTTAITGEVADLKAIHDLLGQAIDMLKEKPRALNVVNTPMEILINVHNEIFTTAMTGEVKNLIAIYDRIGHAITLLKEQTLELKFLIAKRTWTASK